MFITITALEQMKIDTMSIPRAINDVRVVLETNENVCTNASTFLKQLYGIETKFDNKHEALLVVQSMVKETLTHQGEVGDEVVLLQQARDYASTYMNDPVNKFHFVDKTETVSSEPVEDVKSVVEGLSKVAVHADGKIKKGGKGKLAAEMYAKAVADRLPDTTDKQFNKMFVDMLMNSLQMSKAGANTYLHKNTYLHNLKKAK